MAEVTTGGPVASVTRFRSTSSAHELSGGAASPWLGGLAGVVVIVAVWWAVSFLFFPEDQSVPYPHRVAAALVESLGQGAFWRAVAATLGPAALGYLLGNLVAALIAVVVLIVPPSEGLLMQVAVVSSCIPLTALGPILVLMAGPGSHFASVVLAALSVVFTSVVGTVLGLRTASAAQLDVVTTAGGGAFLQLRKVRLIAALPSVVGVLRLAAPAAFLGSVLGEYFLFGVDSGLGVGLLAAQAHDQPVRLWVLGIACGGVAGFFYWLIGLAGRFCAPWSIGAGK